jgi:hypothetical protein
VQNAAPVACGGDGVAAQTQKLWRKGRAVMSLMTIDSTLWGLCRKWLWRQALAGLRFGPRKYERFVREVLP